MAIAWLAPTALIGLGLVVLPIAIHLLVRQHSRTLAYPSLRFLRETRLTAFRRRTLQDAALLCCRVSIIALAAVALAGPILQTPARTASYASRTARAVVVLEGADDPLSSRIIEGAFRSAVFERSRTADAIADAVRWLDRQPPASREVVLAGRLRRGVVTDNDLAVVPEAIGIRFEPVAVSSPRDVAWSLLTRRNGSAVRLDRAVHFESDSTRFTGGTTTAVPQGLVSIVARDADLPLAQAALGAALDAGIAWSDFDRRVVLVWDGADQAAINRPTTADRIIRMPVPSPPSSAADAVHAALSEWSPRPDRLEPVMVAPEQLSSWSRQPGPPAATARPADEGDRRWLWGAVLALLALESWIRRTKGNHEDHEVSTTKIHEIIS